MTWKLFLDDLRPPPDETWVVARTVAAARVYITEYGLPLEMSLDHDLGNSVDAPQLLFWLIDQHLDGVFDATPIRLKVHSANPIGAMRMEGLWERFVYHQENP